MESCLGKRGSLDRHGAEWDVSALRRRGDSQKERVVISVRPEAFGQSVDGGMDSSGLNPFAYS